MTEKRLVRQAIKLFDAAGKGYLDYSEFKVGGVWTMCGGLNVCGVWWKGRFPRWVVYDVVYGRILG